MMAAWDSSLILAMLYPNQRVTVKSDMNSYITLVHFTFHFWQYLLGRQFTLYKNWPSLPLMAEAYQRTWRTVGWTAWTTPKVNTFSIVHQPEECHGNTDALFRLPCCQCSLQDAERERAAMCNVLQLERAKMCCNQVVSDFVADLLRIMLFIYIYCRSQDGHFLHTQSYLRKI